MLVTVYGYKEGEIGADARLLISFNAGFDDAIGGRLGITANITVYEARELASELMQKADEAEKRGIAA